MPAFDPSWFIYLVVISMGIFMLSLGLVALTDRDPVMPPAE